MRIAAVLLVLVVSACASTAGTPDAAYGGLASAPIGSDTPSASNGPALSVRDTGARGDGRTDDTPAFRSALAMAREGVAVVVPPGEYVLARDLVLDRAGQTLVLQRGARLLADATIRMTAPGVTIRGPGTIDERGGVRMGVDVEGERALIDGVEFAHLGRSGYAAFVLVAASHASIRGSWFHDSGADGALLDTDGSEGLTGVEFRGNLFENIANDGIHSKGTNADWRGGAWIPVEKRNSGHRFVDNVFRNVAQVPNAFSLEIQDGHVDTEIRGNQADATYSIVGQLRATVVGSTFVGRTRSWGMEIGNARDSVVSGNRFEGCSIGIAFTGGPDQLNVGNTVTSNTFRACDRAIMLAWDGGQNDVRQ